MTKENGWERDAMAEIEGALNTIKGIAAASPSQVAWAGKVLAFWGAELAGINPPVIETTLFAREFAMR